MVYSPTLPQLCSGLSVMRYDPTLPQLRIGLDRVEPTLRAGWPLGLALYHPTLQWSGWAEPNVLQARSVAALLWAVGRIFYNPTLQWAGRGASSVLHAPLCRSSAVGCGPSVPQTHSAVG